MTRVEKLIVKKIKNEDYVLTVHARERMNERHVLDADIVEAAKTLISIRRQDQNDTYLLRGLSTWKEKLVISVAVRSDIVIVTVFFED